MSLATSFSVLANVPESNVHFMIQRNSWLSGEVYDMYRHDYDKNNKAYSGAERLEEAKYVVYTATGDVYICLNNNNNSPSTAAPSAPTVFPLSLLTDTSG